MVSVASILPIVYAKLLKSSGGCMLIYEGNPLNEVNAMAKKHILVVDDEPNMLNTMEFILEVAKYRVSLASSGKKALDMILAAKKSKAPIDLLITDIQMSGFSGLDLLDKLKESSIDVPVLAITAYGNRQIYSELARRGCKDYMDKPLAEQELISRIRNLLNESASQKKG